MNKKIFKHIVGVSLIATSLSAQVYLGVEAGSGTDSINYDLYDVYNNNFKFTEEEKYSDYRVKIGTGTDGGFKFEAYLESSSYENDENKYPFSNVLSGVALGGNIIKEFEITSSFYPYARVGFSLGGSEDWNGDGLNAGGGILYKMDNTFSLYAGLDWYKKSYDRGTDHFLATIDGGSNFEATSSRLYGGLNIAFGASENTGYYATQDNETFDAYKVQNESKKQENIQVKEADTKIQKDKEVPNLSSPKGRISDLVQVDLLYGYQLMTLNIDTQIKSLAKDTNGQSIELADSGDYSFDSIELDYKKINIAIFDTTFSYELIGNKLKQDTSSPSQELEVQIKEFIGGYIKLDSPNAWLNHTAKWQLIRRKAEFSGLYAKDGAIQAFNMDKTKTSVKWTKLENNYSNDDIKIYTYFQVDYENSTLPMVIYAADGQVNLLDNNFNVNKFTLVGGYDKILASGLFYGFRGGFGLSSTQLSDEAQQAVDNTGVDLGVNLSYNYQLGLKGGFTKKITFEYTEFEAALLYDLEYFKEFSNDVDTSNDNLTLVYDRSELLGTLKVNLRWSF